MFRPEDLFDLTQTEHVKLFEGCELAWDALKKLKAYVEAQARPHHPRPALDQVFIGEHVVIGEHCLIEPGVMIKGPAIIGRNCEIRHNAYLREHVIVGDGCVLGNACEFKHCVLFNGCQVPHFSYVGDSILGFKAHLGAGVKISNVKLAPGTVEVEEEGRRWNTGLRKFGALVGDRTDIGCNAVLNPGSIIGRGSVVYANCCWRGVLPPRCIAKNKAAIEIVERLPQAS
jgi:UDP-N-acetylglucosamine diphosphorylase / glucose-1-phosphate thymidylyltransferase / UDP-N-acetylgalactosamine diphosphorylase / glucosamine-1-phosphate N-acetyltransferase / galactosamine-1-phosphate N-acetyltransferase